MRKNEQKKKLEYVKPVIRSLGKVKGMTQGGWGGRGGGGHISGGNNHGGCPTLGQNGGS